MQTNFKTSVIKNTLRFLLLFLFLLPLSCNETDEEVVDESPLDRESYLSEKVDLSIIDDLMKKVEASEAGLSREQVNKLFSSRHGIDFESEYRELLSDSLFSSIHYDGGHLMTSSSSAISRPTTIRPFIYAFGDYNNVISKFSYPVKKHLTRIINIIDIEDSDKWSTKAQFKEYMLYKVAKIGDDIAYDPNMSNGLKNHLFKALDTYYNTGDKAYDYLVTQEPEQAPNVRFR